MLPNHSSSLKGRASASVGARKDKDGRKKTSKPLDEVQWGLFHPTTAGAALIETLSEYMYSGLLAVLCIRVWGAMLWCSVLDLLFFHDISCDTMFVRVVGVIDDLL